MESRPKMESKCPKCGREGEAVVRHSEGLVFGFPAHIVDIGMKCPECETEWGFTLEETEGK